jgi:hypothetical protein
MASRRDARTNLLLAASAALAVLAIAFVGFALARRPDNPVEAELVFEALRVARGQALYVDPSIGAWEDGGPPSRFYVLYTPVWPWLLAQLAGPNIEAIRGVGRAIATAAWLAIFVVPIAVAPRERRRTVAIASLLGLALYFLARNAPSATPDTLAVALACVGLVRVAKRGHVDPLSAALFAVAPLVKPSCLGVLAGVAIAHVAAREPGRFRSVVTGAGAALAVAFFCHVVSDGTWLTHIVRSTGQPLTMTRFVEQLGSRVVVLGVPHVVVAILAIRRRAALVVIAPLVASLAWSSFSMAKHGSGTQYWIEPTMAAIVAIAFMPARRAPRPLRGAAVVLAFLVAVISVPAYAREVEAWRVDRAELALVDAYCAREKGDVVISSEAALELALDGRLLVPDWQSSFLARRGTFPAAAWRNDLRDPHARWLVLGFDPTAPTEDTNDARVEVSAFRDILRPVVDEAFVRDARIGRYVVFRRREPAELLSRAK